MNKNFTFFAILASILIGGSFGLFSIGGSFAEDNLSVSREDSKAYQKQLEKLEKEDTQLSKPIVDDKTGQKVLDSSKNDDDLSCAAINSDKSILKPEYLPLSSVKLNFPSVKSV